MLEPAGPNPGARTYFSMVTMGTRCFCYGGRDSNARPRGDLAVLDAYTGSWAQLPSLPGAQPAPRSSHTYAFMLLPPPPLSMHASAMPDMPCMGCPCRGLRGVRQCLAAAQADGFGGPACQDLDQNSAESCHMKAHFSLVTCLSCQATCRQGNGSSAVSCMPLMRLRSKGALEMYNVT